MKITALGHGGAFAGMDKGNASFLFEYENAQIPGSSRKMLFDCGTLTPYILRDDMGMDLREIDAVYVSHSHADHTGGLPIFLQSRYWIPKLTGDGKRVLPRLYCNGPVALEIEEWLDVEVKHLRSIGNDERQRFTIDDFTIWTCPFTEKGFVFGPWGFDFQFAKHIEYQPGIWKPTYGLSFKWKGKRVLFTADTANVADLAAYDYVFHDCETLPFKSGVHAHYEEIVTAYNKLDKKPQMYMVHFSNVPENPHPDFKWFQKGESVTI